MTITDDDDNDDDDVHVLRNEKRLKPNKDYL